MYVCIYVCMNLLYVYMYVCMNLCVCISTHVYMQTYLYINTYTHTYIAFTYSIMIGHFCVNHIKYNILSSYWFLKKILFYVNFDNHHMLPKFENDLIFVCKIRKNSWFFIFIKICKTSYKFV